MQQPGVDFEQVVQSIREYLPSVGFGSPFTLDAREIHNPTPELLADLVNAIYERDYPPQNCVFYMSVGTYNDLMNVNGMTQGTVEPGGVFQGHPIRVDATMPDDCVLFMAPDAVGLGGKVYHPEIIAYADLD